MSERFVVVPRHSTEVLFLALTTARTGRKQWQWTEDYHAADQFDSVLEIDRRLDEHRVPRNVIKVKPSTNAHSEWLQHNNKNSIEKSQNGNS